MRARDLDGVWAAQYAVGAKDKSTAKVYRVISGANLANINVRLKSRAKIKAKTTPGKGKVKVALTITRKATGGAAGGTVTLVSGGVSRKVALVKGKATVTVKGLPQGSQEIVATYSGNKHTESVSKTYRVKIT
ncbi:Ig-like domain-containing protein [Aeromicrobium sp. UC242_57]|uniref:Ig-like domain-containing protein n=1 Tax=Aeromicrobium sp. UC242_57 TaxID=3374624 RepID=UPI0037B8F689